MDRDRFDAIARIAATAGSRRAALAAALGAVLGMAALPPAQVAAKKKKCKPKCGPGQRCVKRQCVCDAGFACGPACCTDAQACENGACVPCTITATGDADADGAALKALVENPAGPEVITVGPGFYRLQSTVPGATGLIEARRSVEILACNPAAAVALNCGTMQLQNICLRAASAGGPEITVVLNGIDVTGPGLEPLEGHNVIAVGVSAWENATLVVEDARIGGFTHGVLGRPGGEVILEGGVAVTGNGNGILNTGGADAVSCLGPSNSVTGNDPNYKDCVCVADAAACGCGTTGPCLG